MLIQLTNKCRMGCSHCMADSTPSGGMMSKAICHAALLFAKKHGARHVIFTGGEPTEHDGFIAACRLASRLGLRFSFVSNGMWMGNRAKEGGIEEIAELKGFVGGQIYSNPRYYRLHNSTVEKFKPQSHRWLSRHIHLSTSEINSMSDIGRAKSCPKAMADVRKSSFHNMCLAACVTAAQSHTLEDFFDLMALQLRFCTPLVDWQGNIHMSESWLCPSVGNVATDSPSSLWEGIRRFRPCGGCTPCKRFLTEDSQKMQAARALLGMKKMEKKP